MYVFENKCALQLYIFSICGHTSSRRCRSRGSSDGAAAAVMVAVVYFVLGYSPPNNVAVLKRSYAVDVKRVFVVVVVVLFCF